MLIEMGMRALVFLMLAACSNDQFVAGDDAGSDAEVGPAQEASTPDVMEASAQETGPTTYCASQKGAFFCDDFDLLPKVTDNFSVWTTGSIVFGPGKTGQGLAINASTLSTVYITKQVQDSTLQEADFAIQLGSTSLATYVTITAGTSTFGLGIDLTPNFTIQGDGNTNGVLGKADTSWHTVVVTFESGMAKAALDSKTPVSVTFAAALTTSALNLGVVNGTVGGKVTFDDVVLR